MEQQFQAGSVILGRYVIERLLGEGGMGAVYVARHIELARKRYAVKVLRPEVFGHGEVEQRFRQEAQVLGALDHPGVVSINDYGMQGQTPVMVMELLQGETLRDHLNRSGPMPLAHVVRIVREVAQTLDYTHGFDPPVIHRDLKPENLFLVQPDGRVKVLDFGVAKVAAAGAALTQANTTMGTPQYMSPEQLRDASKVDHTTDVFALASIAFECLTQKLAFPGEGIGGVVLAIFDAERPRVTRHRHDVPPAIDEVLSRAWSIDRRARFATAGEFAAAFAKAAAGATIVQAPREAQDARDPAESTAMAATRMHGSASGPPIQPAARGVMDASATHANTRNALAASAQSLRTPIVLGAALGLIGLGIYAAIALHHAHERRGHPAIAPSAMVVPLPAPVDPTPRTDQAVAPESTVRPSVPADAAAAPHPIVPSAVRQTLDPWIHRCAAQSNARGRVVVTITWNARHGLPQRVHVTPGTPAALRPCIQEAVIRNVRLNPQSSGTVVSRTYAFTL